MRADPTPRPRKRGSTQSDVRAAVPLNSPGPAPTTPATWPSTSAANRVRSVMRWRHCSSLASTSTSNFEPNAYGASFNVASLTSRNVRQSSGPSSRMLVAEDEDLESPAHADRARCPNPQQLPLPSREARRPGAAGDRAHRQGGDARERAREEKRPEGEQPDGVREVALPHVSERTRAPAERARVAGQVEERTGRGAQMGSLQQEVHPRVHEPEQQAGEQSDIPQPVRGNRAIEADRERYHLSSPTMSSVVSATATPALRKASSLLFAVPRLPEMIAPAWPMRLPSGAVRPEMNATVLSRLPRASRSAACSSSLPPISPITTRCVVAGSFSKSSTTSRKVSPSTGSPPIPTMVDWPMPDAGSADATSYVRVPLRETSPTFPGDVMF